MPWWRSDKWGIEIDKRKNMLSVKQMILVNVLFIFFLVTLSGQEIEYEKEDKDFVSKWDCTIQRYIQILPIDFKLDKTYDLLIGLHGHGSNRWQFANSDRPECRAFRYIGKNYDMIMVCPDYRAKTSWMGPSAEADLTQIIDDLKSKYQIGKIFLVGASMGGTSALTYATIHPEAINGITSLNGHANHFEYENFQDAIIESFGGTKSQIPEEYKKRSAEYWPEKLIMPMAFTVGENDKSVPGTSIFRLVEVLKKLNREVFLIRNPLAGHSTSYFESKTAMEYMIKASLN